MTAYAAGYRQALEDTRLIQQVDAGEPGACDDPACPRPKGPHGWCRAHSCGDVVPETEIICRLRKGHGGHWHDSGSQCWLVEATFDGPDPGTDVDDVEWEALLPDRKDRYRDLARAVFMTLPHHIGGQLWEYVDTKPPWSGIAVSARLEGNEW